MINKILRYRSGMTVAELKTIVATWPEIGDDGEPCEVWIGYGNGLSDAVTSCSRLNARTSEDGLVKWADLMLSHEVEGE